MPAVRAFHDQILEKAQMLLRNETSEDEFSRRLISGLVVTATPEKIEAAKKKLSEFLHELADELMEGEAGTEVYSLAAQLIPLTKKDQS